MSEREFEEIGFDDWANCATADPERFEALRLAAIEAVIASAPAASQARLRRLQWRIDQERRLARTPMGACLSLSRMMWQSVSGPRGLQARLAELQHVLAGSHDAPAADSRPSNVIAFSRD